MAKAQFIALCTPMRPSGQVHFRWARAVASLEWPKNIGKLLLTPQDTVGNEIAETRNSIVYRALSWGNDSREVSHLFWLDDDVILSPLALIALHRHHRDIASGVYFTRCATPEPLIFPSRLGGTAPFYPRADRPGEVVEQTLEVWAHGMGLCLIKTDVYRRMAADGKLPPDKYGKPAWYRTTRGELKMKDGVIDVGGTEDLYFLDQAGKLGFKPLVDLSKWAFGWHFDVESQRGFPEQQWQQYSRDIPPTWPTPDGIVTWE